MPNWKKVIVQGSDATLNTVTASNGINALNSGFTVQESTSATLEVQGTITASGHLFASLSFDNTPVTDGVVVYDTANGQLYYTGSYGGGGGSNVIANPGSSEQGDLSTITIDGQNFSIAGSDDDWTIIGNFDTVGSSVNSRRFVSIGNGGTSTPTGNAMFGLSMAPNTLVNTTTADFTTMLGAGLEATHTHETILGILNDKDINESGGPGKVLFSVGNGDPTDGNSRSNAAIIRENAITFCPNGNLILEDYYPASEGGQLGLTQVSSPQSVTVTILFPSFPQNADDPGNPNPLNFNLNINTSPNNFSLNNGHDAVVGNPSITNGDTLMTLLSNYLGPTGLGTDTGTISLTKVEVSGDLDGITETFSLSVGNQDIITSMGAIASNDGFFEVWNTNVLGANPAGDDNAPTTLNGIDNGTGVTYGNGNYTEITANVTSGVNINGSFSDEVDLQYSYTGLGFKLTFSVPAANQLQFPQGQGFYLGKESSRPGSTLNTVLGTADHAAVLANIDNPNATNEDDIAGLRIILGNHDDNVGIATTFYQNNFISFDAKNAQSDVGFTRLGSITNTSNNSGIAYNVTSDKRLKSNIKLTKQGLNIINQIKVREFNWAHNPTHTEVGFVAQELYKVIPHIIYKGGKNPNVQPWAVNPTGLIPYMVKAIQEQQKLIENLQKQIDQLK